MVWGPGMICVEFTWGSKEFSGFSCEVCMGLQNSNLMPIFIADTCFFLHAMRPAKISRRSYSFCKGSDSQTPLQKRIELL